MSQSPPGTLSRRTFAATKFAAPSSAPTHVRRTVLLEHLGQASGARLLLINASAGFGKTTLLQQYRQLCLAAGRQVLWCNLDSADNELPRFTALLQAGLRTLHEEPAPGDERPALEHVLQQLESHTQPLAIVLDEFEVISNPAVLDFFQQMLRALPANVCLAIATRTTPALDLGRMRARGQLFEITPESLRFTSEEAFGYLRDTCQLALSDDEIATLYARTEGWITALYLATLSLKWRTDPAAFVQTFSGSNLELAEYLAEDILTQLEPDCRQFLLQTSVLEQISAPLCDALTGRNDSQAFIQQLQRDNLFLTPADTEHHWFRYHSLFRSFLRSALQREYPGIARELNLDAATWYFAHKRPLDAIEYVLRAEDYDEAARQLTHHVNLLAETGQFLLLLRWLDQIPEAVRQNFPALGPVHAWALIHARRFKDASEVIARSPLKHEAESLRCLLLALTDQPQLSYVASKAQLQTLTADGDYQYRIVAFSLVYSMIASGRFDEARQLLAAIPQPGQQRPSNYLLNVADSLASILDLIQGQLDSALTRLQAAARRPLEVLAGGTQRGQPSLEVVLSLALYERNQLDEAARRLGHMLSYSKDNSSPDALIVNHVLLARIAHLNGERDTWLRLLAELEQLGQRAGSARIMCSAWLERARVATLEQRFETAQHAMRSVEQLRGWEHPETLMYANDVDTPTIARYRLNIALGDWRDSAKLHTDIAQAQARHHHRRALKLRLLYALVLNGEGQHSAALEQLTQALSIASHAGFMRTFIEEGPRMTALLERWAITFHGQALALAIEPQFLTSLLAAVSSKADPARTGSAPAQALTQREMQVLRLLAMGYRNREIAEKMFLSELTVKSHLRKINSKLGAQGRTEAVAIARAQGLLT